MKGSLFAILVTRIDDGLTPSGSAPAGILRVNDLSADFIITASDGGGVVGVDVGGSVIVVFVLVVAEVVEFCDVMPGGVVVMAVLLVVCVVGIFVVLVLVVNCGVLVFTGVVLVVTGSVLAMEEVLGEALQDGNNNSRTTNREITGY
jgi:hypothetical protein